MRWEVLGEPAGLVLDSLRYRSDKQNFFQKIDYVKPQPQLRCRQCRGYLYQTASQSSGNCQVNRWRARQNAAESQTQKLRLIRRLTAVFLKPFASGQYVN